MNRAICLCLLIAGVMLAGCESSEPTMLCGGAPSGINADEASRVLKVERSKWRIIEDSRLAPGDKRPRFDVLTVEIVGFTHGGMKGVLRMQFYNDRLARTLFYPDNLAGYLKALREQGLHLEPLNSDMQLRSASREIRISPRTRVFFYRDYVCWEDTGLVEELDRWISRFALDGNLLQTDRSFCSVKND